MGTMRDNRRLWYVQQDVMRATNHPFSHFGCGNLTTLASLDHNSIREWYDTEYDPRGMTLVVYGQESLDILEQRVKTRFGEIKFSDRWKGPVRAEQSGDIVPSSVLGSWVYVEPLKGIRSLQMLWQIPPQFAKGGNRIASAVSKVLARMGEKSILSKLKSEELVFSLSAEPDNTSKDSAFFYIEAELTTEGLKNVSRVVEIIFQGIGTLGRITLPIHIVEQFNARATLNYKWQARRTDYQMYAEEVYALRMQNLADYPQQSWFLEYAPDDAGEILLKHLTPEKCIAFVQARTSDIHNVTFTSAEPVVGARYTIEAFSDVDMATFASAHKSLVKDVSYAARSEFMPDPNISVIHPVDVLNANHTPSPEPLTALESDDGAFQTTFLAPDDEFGVPIFDLRNTFASPALDVSGDPRKQIIRSLWLSQVIETTEQVRAAAAQGGYRYSH
jgi:secreted Zn-dependent insulinase-like peptidase